MGRARFFEIRRVGDDGWRTFKSEAEALKAHPNLSSGAKSRLNDALHGEPSNIFEVCPASPTVIVFFRHLPRRASP